MTGFLGKRSLIARRSVGSPMHSSCLRDDARPHRSDAPRFPRPTRRSQHARPVPFLSSPAATGKSLSLNCFFLPILPSRTERSGSFCCGSKTELQASRSPPVIDTWTFSLQNLAPPKTCRIGRAIAQGAAGPSTKQQFTERPLQRFGCRRFFNRMSRPTEILARLLPRDPCPDPFGQGPADDFIDRRSAFAAMIFR
jgi:hypothetical protein